MSEAAPTEETAEGEEVPDAEETELENGSDWHVCGRNGKKVLMINHVIRLLKRFRGFYLKLELNAELFNNQNIFIFS